MLSTVSLLGYNISTLSTPELSRICLRGNKLVVVNTINPHSYVVAKNDSLFHESLIASDIIIPDGSGIVFSAKMHGYTLSKIAGYDLFNQLMSDVNSYSGKVFFLGSQPSVLELIIDKVNLDFPNVEVSSFSPPFKAVFSQEDISSFSDIVNAFEPDIVFLGLTAPKQEKLSFLLRNSINTKCIASIGAVFDFYAGTVKRPNGFWIKLHLEWLIRLIGEPKRLWRRNFISTPIFLFDTIKSVVCNCLARWY